MNTRVANNLDKTVSVEARDRSAPAVALSDSLDSLDGKMARWQDGKTARRQDGKTAIINRTDGLMNKVGLAAA